MFGFKNRNSFCYNFSNEDDSALSQICKSYQTSLFSFYTNTTYNNIYALNVLNALQKVKNHYIYIMYTDSFM